MSISPVDYGSQGAAISSEITPLSEYIAAIIASRLPSMHHPEVLLCHNFVGHVFHMIVHAHEQMSENAYYQNSQENNYLFSVIQSLNLLIDNIKQDSGFIITIDQLDHIIDLIVNGIDKPFLYEPLKILLAQLNFFWQERKAQMKMTQDPQSFTTETFRRWFESVLSKPIQYDTLSEQVKVEHLKARSFALQLLSALEDLTDHVKESLFSSSQKQIIKDLIAPLFALFKVYSLYSLETISLTYVDLLLLINLIREFAQDKVSSNNLTQLEAILQNTENLIDLQKDLHPSNLKEKQTSSSWERVRYLVKSGAVRLFGKQSFDDMQAKGFGVTLKIPKPPSLINRFAWSDAINLLSKQYRAKGEWIVNCTKVITLKELWLSLKASCDQLPLLENPAVIGFKNKSQQWLADFGYRLLSEENRPVRCLTLDGIDNRTLWGGFDELIDHHDILIFDDGIYSGSQCLRILTAFEPILRRRSFESGKQPFFEKTRNIYYIAGFSNEERIQELQSSLSALDFGRYNVNIQILCNHLVPTIDDLEKNIDLKPVVNELLIQMLVTTAWKVPDYISFPEFCSEGRLPLEVTRGSHDLQAKKNALMLYLKIKHLHGIAPFSEILPIYKKR